MTKQEDLALWQQVWVTFYEKWPTQKLRAHISDKPQSYQDEFRRRWVVMRDNRNRNYKGGVNV